MRVLSLLLILLLAGCESGAVVFAPTPLPPDLSPLRYEHPSGAFSLSVPRSWSVYTQNTGTLASAAFSPPDSTEALLTVAVINSGQPIEGTRFGELMEQYQTLYRPDLNRYTPQDRQAMGDGSWRLSGYRTTAAAPEAINTFIEFSGSFISVLDVVLSRDGLLQADLQTAINTFRINPQAALQITELSTLSFVRSSSLEVQNVFAWTNPFGVFFVTGEIANYGDQPVSDVPVRASLLREDGTTIIEAVDVAMGYAVPPGGFAPFSLRFGEGKPGDAVDYTVTLGDANWAENPPSPPAFAGAGTLQWQDESTFAADGALLITGSVTNTGDSSVRSPLGVVTVFNAQQEVIAAWFSPLSDDHIRADETIPFEIRIPEIGGDPVNYILDIQALVGGEDGTSE
jgi:hypothetical protein